MSDIEGINGNQSMLPVSRPSAYVTSTLTALNQAVTLTVLEGQSSWDVYLSGTFSSTSQVVFEGSLDNTNWFYLNGRRNTDINTNDTTTILDVSPFGGTPPTGANPSNWRGNIAGVKYFRVRCSIYTTSDSISVQISTSAAEGAVFINAALPTTADKTGAGALAALNATVVGSTNGCGAISFNILGTWVGTLVFEGTNDSGTNWFALLGVPPFGVVESSISSNGTFIVNCAGFSSVRIRASTWTSGTANITWESSSAIRVLHPYNLNASNFLTQSNLFDGNGNLITSTNSQLNIRDVLYSGAQYRAQSVTTSAAEALGAATILSNRKFLTITPTNGIIYYGFNSSVTTTTGSPLFPNNTLSLSVTDNIHVYLIAATTVDVRIAELA